MKINNRYPMVLVAVFIFWRLALLVPVWFGSQWIPYKTDSPYTSIWHFTKFYWPVSHPLVFPWTNFDGVHYLSIAKEGYQANERFFPLYPMLISLTARLLGDGPAFGGVYFFASLFISNGAFLGGLFVLYKFIRLDYSERIAWQSILFLLIFSTAFFFASAYAESVFLLFSLLAFYFMRKHEWIKASIFTSLLTATRLVGAAMVLVLVYEYWMNKKKMERDWKHILALCIAPLGIILYSLYHWYGIGNPLQYLVSQGTLTNGRAIGYVVFPLQTLYRYLQIFLSVPWTHYEWWIALLEVCVFFLVCILIYIGWKQGIRRSYLLYTMVSFVTPVFSGTFSGLPRYILVLFPLAIVFAQLKNQIIKIIYCIVSIILLMLLTALFSRGYYIA